MKKKVVFALLLSTAFCMTKAGIYRHDTPKSKYTELAKEPQFDCVVRLYWKDKWVASGVLIGDRYLLSAAHCFMESMIQQDTMIYDGKKVVVNQPYAEYVRDPELYTVYFKGKKYKSRAVHIFPNYIKSYPEHKGDIALVELTEPVTGVQPATICKTSDELHANIVGVGYGAHGIADQPENIETGAEKIAGENVIDSICGYEVNGNAVSMLCDFDHPTNQKCNRMGSSIPRPLEYITSGGDSGGGAFRKTANGWELIGICGYSGYGGVNIQLLITPGIGYYGQVMEWQRVSAFANWIAAMEKD